MSTTVKGKAVLVASAIAIAICALCLTPLVHDGAANEANAATNLEAGSFEGVQKVSNRVSKNLKQLDLKFDLRKNKAVKFNVYHSALNGVTASRYVRVKQPWTAKITNYKVKNAKKKGYKQATITIKYTSNWKPSYATARKVWFAGWGPGNMGDWCKGDFYYTVLDYKTGANLEAKNPYRVTVNGKWTNSKDTKVYYVDSTGTGWIRFRKASTAKITITYPKNYKNLCLGVGGTVWTYGDDYNNGTDHIYEDVEFFSYSSKKNPFSKTMLYKEGKHNAHFMRIK